MFTQKSSQTHKHEYYRAYKQIVRNGERRYLLMWKCQSCPFSETYDLTADKPGGEDEQR